MNIYSHDGIEVYHGNCLDVIPTLGKFDLIVTDPPYGLRQDIVGDGHDYLEVVGPALRMCWDHLNEGGSMLVFASPEQVPALVNAVGAPLRRLLWMWKMNNGPRQADKWLFWSEAICWFAPDKPVLNLPEKAVSDCYAVNGGCNITQGEDRFDHPCVKPMSVIRELVSRCPVGGRVLDPFCGTGTTLKACKELRRGGVGIEIDSRWIDAIKLRLAQNVMDFGSDFGQSEGDVVSFYAPDEDYSQ